MTTTEAAELVDERNAVESIRTTCCVVGGGPAGAVLGLLLARQGVDVTLLEAHADFDRDFRGDTLHPSVMELMDDIGLAERILELRHSKLRSASFVTPTGPVTVADFGRLDTRFPYITMLPQSDFLELVTREAARLPNFRLLMEARVDELISEDGEVRGVRFEKDDRQFEVRATLTVATDGRSSRVRHLARLEPVKTSPPIDVLWFRLPRRREEPGGVLGRFGRGHAVVMLDRLDEWQIGFVILKGTYRELRASGLEALRKSLAETAPELADRVELLKEWKQVAMLSIESSRLREWYLPGLLLIGDAAHVMSPVGGVGINYAIQDAVVAANVLTAPLLAGRVGVAELREVQRQREWPTRVIQFIQTQVQKTIARNAMRGAGGTFNPPLFLRLLLRIPYLRNIPARVIAFGVRRVRIMRVKQKI
ncbi:MAG TPA: FAD-dependent oxidoreductase [Pyrinomonadaceae bacterium]|nr:FAD-dependent oxidoreductase [Pyrinomonadaceae bacterium]